ncbi:MAG: GAF domain-containing protein [Deltaproteobacteria bacterium]|nr:GAF domain-containing protein [Deltaproteobacteria bacterium]
MHVVPLIGRTDRAGLLMPAYRHDMGFTERDYRGMDGISHQVSTALEEARLYADSVNKTLELSRNIEAIQVMHELDRSILSTLDRDEMLDTAVGLVDRVVPCGYVSAFIVDRGRGVLAAVAGNVADIPKGSLIPFADTLASEIIETGRPQIIPDLAKIKKTLPFEARLMDKGCRSSIRVPLTVKGEVSAVLFIGSNRKAVFTPEDLSMIEKLASQICVALENSRLLTDLNDLFIGIVKSLSEAIDAKGPWTRGHSERVTMFAKQIARKMDMDEKGIRTLEAAGLLHDIGKLGTCENILEKPGKLTGEELRLMQQHPAKGGRYTRAHKTVEGRDSGHKISSRVL